MIKKIPFVLSCSLSKGSFIRAISFNFNLVATPKGITLKTFLGWQLEGGRYKEHESHFPAFWSYKQWDVNIVAHHLCKPKHHLILAVSTMDQLCFQPQGERLNTLTRANQQHNSLPSSLVQGLL